MEQCTYKLELLAPRRGHKFYAHKLTVNLTGGEQNLKFGKSHQAISKNLFVHCGCNNQFVGKGTCAAFTARPEVPDVLPRLFNLSLCDELMVVLPPPRVQHIVLPIAVDVQHTYPGVLPRPLAMEVPCP